MAIVIGGGSGNAISINGSAGAQGQVVVSNGTNASWVNGAGGNGTVYTSPGTFTVGTTCPSAVTSIKITACGGGGNGGNGSTTNDWGGGAGGGATTNVFYRPVSNGQVYIITVGGSAGSTTIALPGPSVVFTCTAGSSANPGPAGGGGGGGGAKSPLAAYAYLGNSGSPGYVGGGPGPPTGYGGDGGTNYGIGLLSGFLGGGIGAYPYASAVPMSGRYGAGGGGGAGSGAAPIYTAASGGPGLCIIEW
jgi:hypothetical protein